MNDFDIELRKIEKLTFDLYSCISFKKGEKPTLEKLNQVFISDGKLINNSNKIPLIMTVNQFIDIFNNSLSSDDILSFYEGEIASKTEFFGKISHRFSTYETKIQTKEEQIFITGINSIQFMKIDKSWFVSSVLWNHQDKSCIIPERYQR